MQTRGPLEAGLSEIARFLATRAPFASLAPEELGEVVSETEIEFYPAGAVIMRRAAVIPIVELARWAGAAAGMVEGSTPERIAGAERAGVLSDVTLGR